MNYTSRFFDEIVDDSLSSARIVVPRVLSIIKPESVVDVGCATGAWLSVFRQSGVEDILGLDGSYVDTSKLRIPAEQFESVDLSMPFTVPREFDLAVSLEVAEHLPKRSAKEFVESICNLAPTILFSAAVPGQGGVHHVNEQWPEYWRLLFAERGYGMFDPLRASIWQDDRVASFYRQNMYLFIRDDYFHTRLDFRDFREITDDDGLMLIEPYILLGLRTNLRRLPHVAWAAIKRRLSRRS
jgi:SAM-dependent methyltransferase